MEPLTLYVLYVETKMRLDEGPGRRTVLVASEAEGRELGQRFVDAKPAEVLSVEFFVLPLEGKPA